MASALIELRQADRDNLEQEVDGEYTITLNDPIAVMNGDTVGVRNVYLDTEASADQKIHIDQDLALTIENGFYYQCLRFNYQDNATLGASTGYLANTGDDMIDGRTYIMCAPSAKAAGNFYLDTMTLDNFGDSNQDAWKPTQYNSNGDGSHKTFYFQCTLLYKHAGDAVDAPNREYTLQISGDASGQRPWRGTYAGPNEWTYALDVAPMTETFSYDPTADITEDYGPNGGVQTQKGLLVKANSWAVSTGSPNGADTIKLQYANYDAGPEYVVSFVNIGKSYSSNVAFSVNDTYPAGNDNYTPYMRSTTFTLEAGDYTPAELTTRINRIIQGNNSTTFANPVVNSNFLIPYNSVDYPDTVWVEEGLNNAFILDTGNPTDAALNGGMLIGATQMVLDYDEDKKVFFWSYIHSPLYGLDGTTNYNEAVGFTKTANLVANNEKVIAISRNSGIFFRSLRAAQPDGTSYEFWGGTSQPGGVLGFDLSKLIPSVVQFPAGKAINGWSPDSLEMLEMPLVTGQNATTGFIGLDDLATRGATSDYWFMPAISAAAPYLADSNGVTREIRADAASLKSTDFGYFLIDVESQWGGVPYVGANGFRSDSIRAVVGRYYSAASYTTGQISDAVPYTHKGEPIVLDSFKVKILGPDKQTAKNLGSDTAVILEVVRAQPAVSATSK